MTHELKRIDEERDNDGYTRWRWVCSCSTKSGRNRKGAWNYQSDNVARVAHESHVAREASKYVGPKVLRDLLKLEES